MKKNNKFIWANLAAAVVATFGADSKAQTIATPAFDVLLPNPPAAAPQGEGHALTKDPFFASGTFIGTWRSAESEWPSALMRLTPGETDWSAEPIESRLSQVQEFAWNPDGRLYAVGYHPTPIGSGRNISYVGQWKVSSAKSAQTWVDEDTFSILASQNGKNRTLVPQESRALGVVSDSDGINPGNVYVAGLASDGTRNHWVIRRKSPSGSWTTVYDEPSQDTSSHPNSLIYFPGNLANFRPAVLVVGILSGRWTVLRSQDQGASWHPVGAWPEDGTPAIAWDAICDAAGNIYVAGGRGINGGHAGAVLRRSSDGGSTWETLLDEPGPKSFLSGVCVDDAGNLTLTGAVPNIAGLFKWVVVRKTNQQTWADSWNNRIFPFGETLSAGSDPMPMPDGSVLVTGRVTNSQSVTFIGLVRIAP